MLDRLGFLNIIFTFKVIGNHSSKCKSVQYICTIHTAVGKCTVDGGMWHVQQFIMYV